MTAATNSLASNQQLLLTNCTIACNTLNTLSNAWANTLATTLDHLAAVCHPLSSSSPETPQQILGIKYTNSHVAVALQCLSRHVAARLLHLWKISMVLLRLPSNIFYNFPSCLNIVFKHHIQTPRPEVWFLDNWWHTVHATPPVTFWWWVHLIQQERNICLSGYFIVIYMIVAVRELLLNCSRLLELTGLDVCT